MEMSPRLDTSFRHAYHYTMLARSGMFAIAIALALGAFTNGHAQTNGAAPAVWRDTVLLAGISTDTAAATQVDIVVRARQREVQFCFEESGLKTDPDLTGLFAMVITLDSLGGVSRVDPSHREWTSPEGGAVESCVMQRALTWKFPRHLAIKTPRHEVSFHFAK
jgi:hypothetical protein